MSPLFNSHAAGIMCTMEYRPVCAIGRDGQFHTFGNLCEAQKAGATVGKGSRCEHQLARSEGLSLPWPFPR